ncbi:MAG TPA: PilZ domain-containing protein, partial [Halieaceae bacterium]|nr:PilZ domain-containing protein [Halieaceae bacterium]
MSDYPNDRRENLRAGLDLPVEVHQGGSVWKQRLVDLSLAGVATDQPDVWDAQYNEPFTLVIHLGDSKVLELHAYLQHVESGR